MSLKRRATVALGCVATLAAATVTAAPASAHVSAMAYNGDGVCERGEVCLYLGDRLVQDVGVQTPFQCSGQTKMYDILWNRTGRPQRAWSGTNCTGRYVDIPVDRDARVNYFWSVGHAG